MAAPVPAVPAQARSRALMLATMLGLLAYVLPLAFAPYAVLSVWLLLLPPLCAWLAVDVALKLRRTTGLPLVLCVVGLPAVVGLAAGWADGAVMDAGQSVLTLWGLWTGIAAGVGAWLILRRVG
jgi:hypothetical protein